MEQIIGNDRDGVGEDERRIALVSLDGGGMRAFISITIWMDLCDQLSEVLGDKELLDMFDLVGGTSTGGILSAGMALLGKTPKEGMEIYKSMGPKIFGYWFGKWTHGVFSSVFGSGAYHDHLALESELKGIFGDKTLRDVKAGKICPTRQKPIPHWFCVATDVTQNVQTEYLFRNYDCPEVVDATDSFGQIRTIAYKTSGGNMFKKNNIEVWKALRCTSAGATFFEAYETRHEGFKKLFSDGGFKWNCPILQVCEEAKCLWPDSSIGFVLSIGTGAPIDNGSSNKLVNVLINFKDTATCGEAQYNSGVSQLKNWKDKMRIFRFNVPGLGDEKMDSIDEKDWNNWISKTQIYMRQSDTRKYVKEFGKYVKWKMTGTFPK
jgi:patatin-like phospholipase/acyl hydrolase